MYLYKILINKKRNNIYFIYKINNSTRPYQIYNVEEKHFFYLDSIDALNYNIHIPATCLTTFSDKEKTFKIRLFSFRNKYYVQKLDCISNSLETISLTGKQYNYLYYQLNKKNYNHYYRISNRWDIWSTSGFLELF